MQQSSSSQPSAKKTKRLIFLVVIPILVIILGAYFYLATGGSVSTENSYVKADKVQISPEVSGRVDVISVKENQLVKKGQLLYSLDKAPFEMAVAQATANLAQVKTNLAELKASYVQKEATVALAKSHLYFTDKEQKRQKNLLNKNYVSASEYDDADQNQELAKLGVIVQQADLARIEQSLGGSVDAPFEQHPNYQAALAQLKQARLDLEHTEIHAPFSGIINEPPKQGQYLMAGVSSMALVAREDLWVQANFTEKELTYVHEQQTVDIEIDTYPDETWHGVVESISPATSSEFSILPAQNATGNWVKVAQRVPVRVRITDADQHPQLRSGLSATTQINTEHKRSLFGFTL